jgi:hydrogenase nickel incorporation protein HypB
MGANDRTNCWQILNLLIHKIANGYTECVSRPCQTKATMIQTIAASPDEIYDIELEHSLLEANAKLASENRLLLDQYGITAIDVMGAIGSGKTTLINRLVERLKSRFGVAVFNGDATTSTDADLIAGQNVPVVQIATVNGCHLDANLIGKALRKVDLKNLKLIFIENIGNLICPAEFPLGSKARIVVVSVTEGQYMVRKHPHMFLGANLVVVNKVDLAAAMEVSVAGLAADVHRLKPELTVIPTSCKNGVGLDDLTTSILKI